MSNYIYNLGASIERALSTVSREQPAVVAAYWANRNFWVAEFKHLLSVVDGFYGRLDLMKSAYSGYVASTGGVEHNRTEFGTSWNQIRDTSSPKQRKENASGAGLAIKALAERALSLGLCDRREYDEFVRQLRVTVSTAKNR